MLEGFNIKVTLETPNDSTEEDVRSGLGLSVKSNKWVDSLLTDNDLMTNDIFNKHIYNY